MFYLSLLRRHRIPRIIRNPGSKRGGIWECFPQLPTTPTLDFSTEPWLTCLITEREISIPNIISHFILKYRVIQKEAEYTGLCSTQSILYLVLDGHPTLAISPDQAYDFYGFNGYEAVYNKSWVKEKENGGADYKSRMYYRLARNLFRFKNDFHGKLSGDKLLWNAGLTLQSFDISSVNIDKLNKNKDPEDMLPSVTDVPGIYELYTKEWGIISPEDANGGWINTLKLGVVYDSRDNRANPWKGIWTEVGIETSQKFLGSEATFGKLYFTHRQFITLVPKKLTFAYRLGYQQTIFGDVPFYYQSQVIVSLLRGATSEGLGGSKSLRGIKRNRVIGDGFAYGNAELRWRAARFSFINQNWYLGINLFSDFGMVTDKIKFTVPADLGEGYVASDYFNPGAEKLHFSAGTGLRLVMNENFIISADFGKALNEQDGGIGFYMGLNYMF